VAGTSDPLLLGQNGDKSGSLPAVAIVDRVLERHVAVLDELASDLQWPTQHSRVVAAARGIYRGRPAGVPTWLGIGAGSGWTSVIRRGGCPRSRRGPRVVGTLLYPLIPQHDPRGESCEDVC
jgi:hypothetical protein